MLKSGLVDKLREKLPELRETEVALVLDCILGQMTDALAQGDGIEIRGFGSFSLRHRPPRLARNPRTGETVNLSAKVATHFKPDKEMRDWVDSQSKPISRL